MAIGKVISGLVLQKPDKLKVPIIKWRKRELCVWKRISSERKVSMAIGRWNNWNQMEITTDNGSERVTSPKETPAWRSTTALGVLNFYRQEAGWESHSEPPRKAYALTLVQTWITRNDLPEWEARSLQTHSRSTPCTQGRGPQKSVQWDFRTDTYQWWLCGCPSSSFQVAKCLLGLSYSRSTMLDV